MLETISQLFGTLYSPYISFLLFISGAYCLVASPALKVHNFKKEGKLSLFIGIGYIAFSFGLFMIAMLI
jgi:hypothetical protein